MIKSRIDATVRLDRPGDSWSNRKPVPCLGAMSTAARRLRSWAVGMICACAVSGCLQTGVGFMLQCLAVGDSIHSAAISAT
jgi:hypothetical protein